MSQRGANVHGRRGHDTVQAHRGTDMSAYVRRRAPGDVEAVGDSGSGGQGIRTGVVKFGALIGDHSLVGANAVLSPGTVLAPHTVVARLGLIDQGPG